MASDEQVDQVVDVLEATVQGIFDNVTLHLTVDTTAPENAQVRAEQGLQRSQASMAAFAQAVSSVLALHSNNSAPSSDEPASVKLRRDIDLLRAELAEKVALMHDALAQLKTLEGTYQGVELQFEQATKPEAA